MLARMCMAAPHRNPDGARIESPHFHTYRESCGDKFASETGGFESLDEALIEFCDRINLPTPKIQGLR